MKRIEISVKNLVAWQTNSTDYVCGNSKFVVCFDFDKEWNEFETKTARFYHDGEYTDIVFTGTECKVPVILNAKRMEVGVFAGDLHTTTPAVVHCRKSILCDSGTPADPPPDVYAQIMERLDNGVSPEQIAQAVADYLNENPVETGSTLTNGVVELIASKWEEVGEKHYSQVVTIEGVTPRSQIDPKPNAEQLAVFYNKEMMLVFENEAGVVTAHLIGQRLENDYIMQVAITEVGV